MEQCIIHTLIKLLFINAKPACTIALWIKVNDEDFSTQFTKSCCEIHRCCGLTDTALLIDDCNGVQRFRAFRPLYVSKTHNASL